jgi:hypothetical protein
MNKTTFHSGNVARSASIDQIQSIRSVDPFLRKGQWKELCDQSLNANMCVYVDGCLIGGCEPSFHRKK